MALPNISLKRKVVGSFQSNVYCLNDESSGRTVLVDAGADAEELLTWLGPLKVELILLTHGHPDHVGALTALRRALDAPVGIHPADAAEFDIAADQYLETGGRIALGACALEIVHIPGHTPGGVAFRLIGGRECPAWALVGDAIFPGGPGHTRSHTDLLTALDALRDTVFTWPDATVLYPGHGEATTVGDERAAFERFRSQRFSPDLHGDVTWR
jgi:glyoxylase-like metal-dependent hydrolase (beta-lactamase superfamily II)